jgi:hypothetical protein
MVSPDTLQQAYQELLSASSNTRQRESLERINKACDFLEEQGLRITPSAVERYCVERDWGGPKAQSIRNSQALSKYLKLRESKQTVNLDRRAKKSHPLIPDQTLRAYVQLLQEERDQAKAARSRIEAGLRTLPGVPIDDLIRLGFGGQPLLRNEQSTAKLNSVAIEAIQLLLTETRLGECGLQLYKDRLRQSLTGNILLEKKHVEALRKLVDGSPAGEAGGDLAALPSP